MGLAFKILRYSPTNNPDTAEIGVTATGNYVTAVGGSAADLSPGNISDPNGVGLLGEPSNQPSTPPSIEAESLDGYYAELIPAAAGAALSGSVTFSDGVTGKWIVDQYGRPGFTEISKPGYRPTPADAQAFVRELSTELQKRGF